MSTPLEFTPEDSRSLADELERAAHPKIGAAYLRHSRRRVSTSFCSSGVNLPFLIFLKSVLRIPATVIRAAGDSSLLPSPPAAISTTARWYALTVLPKRIARVSCDGSNSSLAKYASSTLRPISTYRLPSFSPRRKRRSILSVSSNTVVIHRACTGVRGGSSLGIG